MPSRVQSSDLYESVRILGIPRNLVSGYQLSESNFETFLERPLMAHALDSCPSSRPNQLDLITCVPYLDFRVGGGSSIVTVTV